MAGIKMVPKMSDLKGAPTGEYFVVEEARNNPAYIKTIISVPWGTMHKDTKHYYAPKKYSWTFKLAVFLAIVILSAAVTFIYYGVTTGCYPITSGHYVKCSEL